MKNYEKLTKQQLIARLKAFDSIGEKVTKINDTEMAKEAIRNFCKTNNQIMDYSREHFGVILLDTKNNILDISILFIGTLDKSVIETREIFKHLFKYDRCKSFIIFHNHPSGNLTPSTQDIKITDKLTELAKELQFNLLDSIIISDYAVNQFSITND